MAAELRANFFKVAERVESLSGIIDPSKPRSLISAQTLLMSIVADLGEMAIQGQRIDSEQNGSEGGSGESGIVTEVFGLLDQTKVLLGHVQRALDIQSRMAAGGSALPQLNGRGDDGKNEEETDSEDEADPADDNEELDVDEDEDEAQGRVSDLVKQNEEQPLSREEIGKLLILTSRAFKSEIISGNQRSFLKGQIIARHGMLRVVLQFPTVESILNALKTISSSVDQ